MALRLLENDRVSTESGRCSEIRILVVDDDEVFREALADNLRADGHEVEECGSTAGALAAMKDGRFSLMISDYSMPGGNGIELTDRFHALQAEPAVIVTAYSNPILQTQLKSREHLSLLRKPADYDELHRLVHRVVEGAHGDSRRSEKGDRLALATRNRRDDPKV
jgi:DNA-binding NtrC family response regulator